MNFVIKIIFLFVSSLASAESVLPIDYWVVEPIDSRKILSTSVLPKALKNKVIRINVAKNEFEPASFVIKSNLDLSGLVIQVSDLSSKKKIIKSELIDIKLIKEWYQGDQAWTGRYNKRKEKNLVPELMLNDDSVVKVDYDSKTNYLKIREKGKEKYIDITEPGYGTKALILEVDSFDVRDKSTLQPFNIQKNTNKQIWLTVKPTQTEAGLYVGSITLTDDQNRTKKIAIELNVRDFNLCESNIDHSIYYRASLDPKRNTISSEIKNEVQLEMELMDMRDHGVINPNIYQNTSSVENLDKYLSIREKVGISNDTLYFASIKVGRKKQIIPYKKIKLRIDRIKNILKKHNVKNFYIYGIDEARDEMLDLQLPLWKRLKREAKVKIFVAGYTGTFEKVGKELDLFVHARKLNPSILKKFHSVGHKVYSYNNPQVGAENPFIYRKNYGISLWSAGYDGAMNYAYMTSHGSTWNDYDHKLFRDHNFSYPTTNGVINTIAWEGFREGVDDIKYIATLEKASKNTKLVKQLYEEINSYLSFLKRNDNFDLVSVRNKIADYIIKAGGGC